MTPDEEAWWRAQREWAIHLSKWAMRERARYDEAKRVAAAHPNDGSADALERVRNSYDRALAAAFDARDRARPPRRQ